MVITQGAGSIGAVARNLAEHHLLQLDYDGKGNKV
jgi:hypothetical protein